ITQVKFNTWQFSQFNLGDQLPCLFMNKLIKSVSDGEEQSKLTAVLGKLAQTSKELAKTGANIVVSYASGGGVTDISNPFEGDFFDQFEKLKDEFESMVQKKAPGSEDRIVIYVDDLDRLQPGRAVELLEVLKIFLDCEKCVFVLAIDYDVVARGVREKYGDDFSDEKGKSFFDKIIQAPFKMPIANYDITNYVGVCLREIDLPPADEEEQEEFADLITHSIGNNPRGMKRLFNSYLLLSQTVNREILEKDRNKKLLFAVLCMQSSFESIYNYMVYNAENIDQALLSDLRDEKCSVYDELQIKEENREKIVDFMQRFYNVVDKDHDDGISVSETADLRNILTLSTVTSSSAEMKKNSYVKVGLNELGLDAAMNHYIEKLMEWIRQQFFGLLDVDNVEIMQHKEKSRSPYISYRLSADYRISAGEKNRRIVSIYLRKGSLGIDLYTKKGSPKPDEHIQDLLYKSPYASKSNKPENFMQGSYTTINIPVEDEKAETYMYEVFHVCLDTYLKN
ncbi:MAG: KAP family NTPase, partial [Lachnospiraceae bacterium]|nr:KAP family NTPase [Lachnospiraceae bacterium]